MQPSFSTEASLLACGPFTACARLVLAALLVVLVGCSEDAPRSVAASAPTPVVTAMVEPVEWRDSIEALGTARANESVMLTAKVSETVRRVAFESGDQVRAGDVLVELSNNVELAGLEEALADYREAERLLERQEELAARGLIAVSELDTQRSIRDAARARMEVVRAQIEDRVITAPFDGVLGVRQVSVGSLVTPGTPIATLDDISVINLDFSVPERYLAVLGLGQDVTASSTTYPGQEFSGKVAHIESRVDPVTRSVAVRAEIPNPDRLLRPGMLLSVTLFMPARETLSVNEIAVVQVGLESFVFRVRPDETVEQVAIELGARRAGEVEVISGLTAGERIVVEGTVKLTDGARVTDAAADAQETLRAATGEDATADSATGTP